MKEANLYVINMDSCPDKYDSIIKGDQCGCCDHYRGFELYNGQRCIRCSFYADIENNASGHEENQST